MGLNGLNGLAGTNGALDVNILPATNNLNGYTRYWDFGQFGNTNGLYNTLMQTPQ